MTPTEMAEAIEYVDIHAHDEVGCVMWIDYFWVPHELRGRGVGRAAFEDFVRHLDPGITRIELVATDEEGQGNSEGFWAALGFSYKYDDSVGGDARDLDADAVERDILERCTRQQTMWMGVNGHSTPPPICTELQT